MRGFGWRQFSVAGICVAVLMSLMPAAVAAPEPESRSADAAAGSLFGGPAVEDGVAPDVVSAQISARASGKPIEVESLRDEFSTTWVNPDGTLTTDAHQGQIRFRDEESGAWTDVDLAMRADADGSAGVVAHPLGVQVAGRSKGADGSKLGSLAMVTSVAPADDASVSNDSSGSESNLDEGTGLSSDDARASKTPDSSTPTAEPDRDDSLVRGEKARERTVKGSSLVQVAESSERTVSLVWPGVLPAPTVKGGRARYEDVTAGVDVVIESRRSGFQWDVQVTTDEARDRVLASHASGDPWWEFGLDISGLTAKTLDDGSIGFHDDADELVSVLTAPRAWDGEIDPRSLNRVNEIDVDMSLVGKGANARVRLSVDREWFASKKRVFPITVDPTYASASITTNLDTEVSKAHPNTTYHTSKDLRVGTHNGGTEVMRSFLNFKTDALVGKDIVNAKLSIYEYHAWSCTAKGMQVHAAGTASTSTKWSNQPSASTLLKTVTVAKGYSSSCKAGRVTADITSQARTWAGQSAKTVGIRLKASSETDNFGWKRFRSSETSDDPKITFTYNRPPNTVWTPTVVGGYSYTPAGGTLGVYTSRLRPSFSVYLTEPDANKWQSTIEVHSSKSGTGGTLVTSCVTGWATSGGNGGCTVGIDLIENTEYFVRAKAKDERGLWNASWSAWQTVRIAAAVPAQPVIDCPDFPDVKWSTSIPLAPVACTVTATGSGFSAPSKIELYQGTMRVAEWPIPQSNNPGDTQKSFTIPNTAGTHTYIARAVTPSALSADRKFEMGFGLPTLEKPANGVTSTGTLPVIGTLPALTASVHGVIQYRRAGAADENAEWENHGNLALVTNNDLTRATGAFNMATLNLDDSFNRRPVAIEVRACLFTLPAPNICLATSAPSSVVRLPSAFGDGFPVDDSAGVAQVAQFTGEYKVDESDVDVATMSVARSYSSFGGDGSLDDEVRGIFGPGWTAEFGALSGMAEWVFDDATHTTGTVSLTDPEDGTVLVWAHPSGVRKTHARTSGQAVYVPMTEETEDSDIRLVLKTATGTPSSVVFEATEFDGTTTTWAPTATLNANAQNTWRPHGVIDPSETTAAHTFYFPGTGADSKRVAHIVSVPVGKTMADCPATGAWTATARGCSRLDIEYGASNTGGDATGQVKKVSATIWDPQASGTNKFITVPMVSYSYDSHQRLVSATDNRSGLTTNYAWQGTTSRLTVITPAGLAPYRFWYQPGEGNQKVSMITRDPASGTSWNNNHVASPPSGSTPLARYHYGIDPAGDGTHVPDLAASTIAAWHQKWAPESGYAVFGPDFPWDTPLSHEVPEPDSDDWRFASIAYATDDGYTVNTANYGAGSWLVDATDYDSEGRVIRGLDTGAITYALDNPGTTPGEVDAWSTQTFYDDNSNVTSVLEPRREAVSSFVSMQGLRPHTKYTYDQGAPNSNKNPATDKPYGLVTRTQMLGREAGGSDVGLISDTITGYAPIESGDSSGWDLGQATTVAQRETFFPNSANDIVTRTRYDARGRVIEVRQPLATSSNHPGTSKTAYYTSDAHPSISACGNRPEWEGMVCQSGPGGSVGNDSLPTTTYEYNKWWQPTIVEETATKNGIPVTRTTTTSYDAKDRVDTVTETSTIPGSVARPGTKNVYDNATGELTTTRTIGTSTEIVRTFDGWGRETAYTNAGGATTTTSYDAAGNVAEVADPKGTVTYTYDGADANGKLEHRGQVTKLKVTRGNGAGNLTYRAAYDADGNLVRQRMPGGVGVVSTFDEVGQLDTMTYTGQITPVTEQIDPETGETSWIPGEPEQDQPWMAWSRKYDIAGRVVAEWNGAGAVFEGVPGVSDPTDIGAPSAGQGLAADRRYIYDFAGRLTRVDDRTAADTGITLDSDTQGDPQAPCMRREYGFDKNGNRTKFTASSTTSGDCFWVGVDDETNHTYDGFDRPIKAGDGTDYSYDGFGRQTLIPAADAPEASLGDIALSYFDDDLAHSISQDGVTTTFALDPAGRRLTQTTTGGTGTTSLLRQYGDDSDNPAWATNQDGYLMRFTPSLDGLGAIIDADGNASIPLANPHGDNVTTITIPETQDQTEPVTQIGGWADYTEYGVSKSGQSRGWGYGWLGSHERATMPETAGLTLMGSRLYNPVRGAFTSVDPVPGGNTTAYTYPQDPIGQMDLDGQKAKKKKWQKRALFAAKWMSKGSNAFGAVPFCAWCSGISAGLGVASAGLYLAGGSKKKAKKQMVSTAANVVLGGARVVKYARPLARSKSGAVKVSTARAVRAKSTRFLRSGGVSGMVARGAQRNGRSRAYVGYTRATNYAVRQGISWRS